MEESKADHAGKPVKVNSSTRLYWVLNKLTGSGGNSPTGTVMALELGILTSDQPKSTWRAASVLYRMMEVAEREIEYYLARETDFYLPVIGQIRSALNPNSWGTPWNQHKNVLTPAHLTQVLNTGQRLKTLVPECELDSGSLESISASVAELRAVIDELTVSEAAKHRLRQRCSGIELAIAEYKFWGVEAIEISFQATQGELLSHVEKDENGSLTQRWQKISRFIVAIARVLGEANMAYKNVHESVLLLGSVGHSVVQHAAPIIEAIEHKR